MPRTEHADPLARYRAMRDFTKTPEPSGATAPPPGSRFVVQRHRARRLHYDFRLESGGVLLSWAVPKGPTLDPKVRRMAVHVEDHPLDYFDFEGVIPRGEYGGGDVIIWDWGTWAPAEGTDIARAVADGNLHFDLDGEKLHGRFVLVRKGGYGRGGGQKEQWLLLHKDDDFAVPGWDPEAHDRSVKSGRTSDEVAAAPAATWHSNRGSVAVDVDGDGHRKAEPTGDPNGETAPAPTWPAPTEDELEALDALRPKGRSAARWSFAGQELKLTNLDKVLFPPGEDGRPVTKRDLIRYYAMVAPDLLPYLEGRPVNMRRFPDGVDAPGFWHKEAPAYAPDWITRWRNAEADPGETGLYFVLDQPAALAWVANYAGVELNPWTSRIPQVHQPTWALIDIDPGTTSSFDDVLVLARLYRAALEHLHVQGMPKVTGKRGVQIWVPVAPGSTFAETRAWVETLSRAVGAMVPELVSWRWEKRDREGLARLDYTQNAINKTLVAPFSPRPAAGAPVSVPVQWDELDDPGLRPDSWTIFTVLDRLAAAGDPLRPLVGLPQHLPPL